MVARRTRKTSLCIEKHPERYKMLNINANPSHLHLECGPSTAVPILPPLDACHQEEHLPQGQDTAQLSAIASYAYTDSRITKSEIASEVNQRSEDTPYNQAALWLNYNFALFGAPKLHLAGGARFQGETRASGIPEAMPSYTLFDAMASYEIDKNWSVALNANNVTNKRYTYCEFAICRYGDERELISSVSFKW
jgi:outer membrane receptor protein involved in Fe transport